jgi:hypothetical protein
MTFFRDGGVSGFYLLRAQLALEVGTDHNSYFLARASTEDGVLPSASAMSLSDEAQQAKERFLTVFVYVAIRPEPRRKDGGRNLLKNSGREIYSSSNGDRWFLARDAVNGHAYIIHDPNQASGGKRTQVEVGTFLKDGGHRPEHHAFLSLIGSLADEPSGP